MKVLKVILTLTVLSLIAYIAYSVVINRIQSNELSATEFMIINDGDSITLTLNNECDDVKVNINDELINAKVLVDGDNVKIALPNNKIEQNEILLIEIIMLDKLGAEIDTAVISNICISKDGKVPKHGIETLLLYDYEEDGFPEFNHDNLKSLIINNSGNTNVNINDINHIVTLKSLYIKGMGGSTKSLKSFENLRRLVIKDSNVDGDLDAIDGLTIIKELSITSTNINGDLKDLVPLDNIEVLHLESNRNITGDIKWLKKFKHVEKIELIRCDFSGDLSELENLENLIILKIDNSKKITGSIELDNGEKISAD